MDGRREQLDRGGRGKLRDGLTADSPAHLGAQTLRDDGAEQRRDVEGREDGQTVAQREEGVGGRRHGARRPARAEQFHVHLVLVDAEPDIRRRGGSELVRPRRHVRGGLAAHRGGGRVERVRGQVRAAVQHEDERDGAREEHRARACEQSAQRGLDAFGEGAAAGCVFHDGPARGGMLVSARRDLRRWRGQSQRPMARTCRLWI